MLSSRIKQLRTLKGITQSELANALHVTKQCVSNWENDNILPSVKMLCKIADYFSVSTDYLLCREHNATLAIDGLSESETQHIQNIVNDLKALKNK